MVIGIIGGGQLGMFLTIAAYQMGHTIIVYDEKSDCCAANVATKFIQGSFDDKESLENFMKQCDVITYEFENVNNQIIADLAKIYNIPQQALPLRLASSRLNERTLAQELDINQPKWQYVDNKEQLNLEYPYILKTDSLGYDGKGQYHINSEEDLTKVDFSNMKFLAEEKISFDYEISLIAIRSISNEMVIYPPFYNIHQHGILNITLIDQIIPESTIKQAQDAINKIINKYNIYGILCCEFLVKDNQIYFNEMAPRPHNSGHISMDTHYCSQYENHLRAILGLPLGTTKIKSNGFMVNVLGQNQEETLELLNKYPKSLKYYDYHKEARLNRKIGHLVCFDDDLQSCFIEKWNKVGDKNE